MICSSDHAVKRCYQQEIIIFECLQRFIFSIQIFKLFGSLQLTFYITCTSFSKVTVFLNNMFKQLKVGYSLIITIVWLRQPIKVFVVTKLVLQILYKNSRLIEVSHLKQKPKQNRENPMFSLLS